MQRLCHIRDRRAKHVRKSHARTSQATCSLADRGGRCDFLHTFLPPAYHQHFGHYHTAGVPGRHDLDEEQELYYPAIMRAIQATGYEGYVGHEFVPKGDPVTALKAAFALCDVQGSPVSSYAR